jgi:hypothetical protein
MLQKSRDFFEAFLLFCLSLLLGILFLVSVPISKAPHGLLVMNELSDFSNESVITFALFGSAAICVALGILLMGWIPALTEGMIANLLSTTYFLLWVDSVFGLSLQFQTFHFLECFGMGFVFIYFFFFSMGYLDLRDKKGVQKAVWKEKLIHYWLGGWMFFYFSLAIILVFLSLKYSAAQIPLAIGFLGICFLNYLLLLFLKKTMGYEIGTFSKVGRIFFGFFFLSIALIGSAQAWFH